MSIEAQTPSAPKLMQPIYVRHYRNTSNMPLSRTKMILPMPQSRRLLDSSDIPPIHHAIGLLGTIEIRNKSLHLIHQSRVSFRVRALVMMMVMVHLHRPLISGVSEIDIVV